MHHGLLVQQRVPDRYVSRWTVAEVEGFSWSQSEQDQHTLISHKTRKQGRGLNFGHGWVQEVNFREATGNSLDHSKAAIEEAAQLHDIHPNHERCPMVNAADIVGQEDNARAEWSLTHAHDQRRIVQRFLQENARDAERTWQHRRKEDVHEVWLVWRQEKEEAQTPRASAPQRAVPDLQWKTFV